MSEPKQSNQLFKGVMFFRVPEKMNIDNAALNIVYDIETGKEHESIAPILLDYDPLERITELEAVISEIHELTLKRMNTEIILTWINEKAKEAMK